MREVLDLYTLGNNQTVIVKVAKIQGSARLSPYFSS